MNGQNLKKQRCDSDSLNSVFVLFQGRSSVSENCASTTAGQQHPQEGMPAQACTCGRERWLPSQLGNQKPPAPQPQPCGQLKTIPYHLEYVCVIDSLPDTCNVSHLVFKQHYYLTTFPNPKGGKKIYPSAQPQKTTLLCRWDYFEMQP